MTELGDSGKNWVAQHHMCFFFLRDGSKAVSWFFKLIEYYESSFSISDGMWFGYFFLFLYIGECIAIK
ncbi:hypothetical protein DICVIV_14474, partial [Dictyocaulus viviparus]